MTQASASGRLARVLMVLGMGAILAAAVAMVGLSLRQPEVAVYAPTPAVPRDVGRALVGPVLYTVEATRAESWTYFAFHLGSVIEHPGPRGWDLAFRRYEIIANGGGVFAGAAGVVDLGEVAFAEVTSVPEGGYQVTEGGSDPRNPALARWYSYGFFSHVLSPKRRVFAVRTADRRYAKLELVSYYCPGARPGCVTFRYVYQGDGSRNVAPALPHAGLLPATGLAATAPWPSAHTGGAMPARAGRQDPLGPRGHRRP